MNEIRVEYSENSSATKVAEVDKLFRLLDEIESNVSPDTPIIVFVYVHGYQVGLGLGSPESFLQFEHESGEPPYIVSVGDDTAGGELAFYLFGNHHTEISRRYLISADLALEGLKYWIQNGVRPKNIIWEEV